MHVHKLFDLSGKTALVTGGSRGLGLEIATALGEAGAAVALTARRAEWLSAAETELRQQGIDVVAIACNVASPDDVKEACATVIDRFGQIDVLVNNAGISWGAAPESMPLDKWHEVMETNATGVFLMSQQVGREMIRAGTGGVILNVASIAGLAGTDPELLDAVGYSASKGAVIAFTRDLAVKWARHGIRVNAIAPGFFPTRLTKGVLETGRDVVARTTPMRRPGRPGELKGVALFLTSAASDYVTGQVIAVDGGRTAW